MTKTVVVVATVYIVLVISFYQTIRTKQFGSIRTARRLGYNNSPLNFDPMMESIERSFDTKTDKNLQHDSTYLVDDHRLNTTYRIMVLFPFLDIAPKDGFIDHDEMELWIVHQAIERLNFRTKQALELHDKNGDGFVSFPEYLPQISNQDLELTETIEKKNGEAGWWYEQFKNADADHNGLLNFDELKDFLHPEDSANERIQEWLLKDEIRQMDYDNDHKLDRMEFETGAYDAYLNCIAFQTKAEDKHVPSEEEVFSQLDINQDELLDLEELKPFLPYINPGEMEKARHYTRYLIDEADQNEDGKLTIHEIINNDHVFYNSLHHHTRVSGEEMHEEL